MRMRLGQRQSVLKRKRENGKERNAAKPAHYPRHRRWFLFKHSLVRSRLALKLKLNVREQRKHHLARINVAQPLPGH
jgi:hypothetical protein